MAHFPQIDVKAPKWSTPCHVSKFPRITMNYVSHLIMSAVRPFRGASRAKAIGRRSDGAFSSLPFPLRLLNFHLHR